MKTIFTSLCALAIATASFSQNVIEEHFSELSNQDDLTHITISGKMFEMMLEIDSDDPEIEEMLEAFSGVQGVEAYGNDQATNDGFLEAAVAQLGSEFEELMTIEDPEMHATVYIKESNGVVTELVAIGEGNDGWGIGTIWGELDLNYVAKMASEAQVSGFKHLDANDFDTASEITIFPNPSSANDQVTYNVPDNLKGGTYSLFDNAGKLIRSGKISSTNGQVSLSGLSKANYVLKFESNTGESYTKQFLVR